MIVYLSILIDSLVFLTGSALPAWKPATALSWLAGPRLVFVGGQWRCDGLGAGGRLPLEKEAHAPWALERQVRLVAGLLILLGLGLSLVWPMAIALAWFVPLGLVFAALTDSCMMGMLLAKLPWNRRVSAACLLPKGN